jgi:hypothetical protein
VLAGPWLLDAFMAIAPPVRFTLPRYVRLSPDGVTFALTVCALAAAAVIAGVAPAMLGRQVTPGEVLRESSRAAMGSRAEKRWSSLLIGTETALTLVPLVAGTVLVRSYGQLGSADLGFDRDRIAPRRVAIRVSKRVGSNENALSASCAPQCGICCRCLRLPSR